MEKFYQVLGLKIGASQQEIKEAYERLSVKLDPKINGYHDFFVEEFALLNKAYNHLSNNSNTISSVIEQNHPDLDTKENTSKNYKTNSSSNSKWIFIIVIFIIIIILLIVQKKKSYSDDYSNENNQYDHTIVDTSAVAVDTTSLATNEIEYYLTPENGFSPYNDYFGKGVYDNYDNNEFLIKNSNETDAVVCLVDFNSEVKIRNEFVRKGTTFKMSNVPNGTYYLAWFSGNDWSPNLMMNGSFLGGFQSNASFSKSDGANDLMICEGNMRWTVTLYSIENGNMETKDISEGDFFK